MERWGGTIPNGSSFFFARKRKGKGPQGVVSFWGTFSFMKKEVDKKEEKILAFHITIQTSFLIFPLRVEYRIKNPQCKNSFFLLA